MEELEKLIKKIRAEPKYQFDLVPLLQKLSKRSAAIDVRLDKEVDVIAKERNHPTLI